jgi:hypothetical protein
MRSSIEASHHSAAIKQLDVVCSFDGDQAPSLSLVIPLFDFFVRFSMSLFIAPHTVSAMVGLTAATYVGSPREP